MIDIARREFIKLIAVIVASTTIPSVEYSEMSLEDGALYLRKKVAKLCDIDISEMKVNFFQLSNKGKYNSPPWIFYITFSLKDEYGFYATDDWLVVSNDGLLKIFLDKRTANSISEMFKRRDDQRSI